MGMSGRVKGQSEDKKDEGEQKFIKIGYKEVTDII